MLFYSSQFGWSSGPPRSASGQILPRIMAFCMSKLKYLIIFASQNIFKGKRTSDQWMKHQEVRTQMIDNLHIFHLEQLQNQKLEKQELIQRVSQTTSFFIFLMTTEEESTTWQKIRDYITDWCVVHNLHTNIHIIILEFLNDFCFQLECPK